MKTLPSDVARRIFYHGIHPIKAWRLYYGITQELLAMNINVSVEEIMQIEDSNLHLREDIFTKLNSFFQLDSVALNIRYVPNFKNV